MAITTTATGAIVVEGEDGMRLYRMLALKSGLSLEMHGIKMSRRGRTCYSIIKQEFGLRGNKLAVLQAFTALCNEQSSKVVRVVETER